MTDKRIKMDCPFCHTPPEQIQIVPIAGRYSRDSFYRISCPNPECGCSFQGYGKQVQINKWNRR